MIFVSILIAFALLTPSSDAAIIATTKQKKLPTIANARVEANLRGFQFDIVQSPTMNAYDVWMRLENERGKKVGEWFVKSMKLRHRSKMIKKAAFNMNVADMLTFERFGTYALTIFVCPANLRTPNRVACATADTTVDFVTENDR